HTYTKWGQNDTEHWKYCEADNEIDQTTKKAHDYANGDCECGKEKPTVSLNKTELKLGIGNTEAKLTATVKGGEVVWSSSAESVVLVGEEGDVEALKPGTATITATVKGTQISASCKVDVETAYYVIGSPSATTWNPVGVFGQQGIIYFMPTQTEGIYKTASFEVGRAGEFKIAEVGYTATNEEADPENVWWKHALDSSSIASDNTVLGIGGGGNISIAQHGKYTLTLNLTDAEHPAISGVCDEVIDDSNVEIVYYLRGSMNGWNEATSKTDAGFDFFTKQDNGTYTLTVNELAKDVQFKVAIMGSGNNGWDGALGSNSVAPGKIKKHATATVQLVKGGDNIQVGVAGKYEFTISADGKLDYKFTATNATVPPAAGPFAQHYYIKGTALGADGWGAAADEATELIKDETTHKNTKTFEMAADGEFMFYSLAQEEENGEIGTEEYEYFSNENSAFTCNQYTPESGEATDCVTANGSNYKVAVAGCTRLPLILILI
ncbi:MAG: Ig-like domain-containing protein, partial [Clostridiales bacterium]|nr:Ig-like domain-containing protein [Clostridiales bacterium]